MTITRPASGALQERPRMAASPPRKKRKPAAKSARDGGPKEAVTQTFGTAGE
jgi:hypothetical protein